MKQKLDFDLFQDIRYAATERELVLFMEKAAILIHEDTLTAEEIESSVGISDRDKEIINADIADSIQLTMNLYYKRLLEIQMEQ